MINRHLGLEWIMRSLFGLQGDELEFYIPWMKKKKNKMYIEQLLISVE